MSNSRFVAPEKEVFAVSKRGGSTSLVPVKRNQLSASTYFEDSHKKNIRGNPQMAENLRRAETSDLERGQNLAGMKASNYNDMPLSQYYENILHNRAKEKDRSRDGNKMFRSQTLTPGGNGFEKPEIARDITGYSLPPELTKFVDEEPKLLEDLVNRISAEKQQINNILASIQEMVSQQLEIKRKSLFQVFDQYIEGYQTAREVLQHKLNLFKDTSNILGGRRNTGSNDRLMTLSSVAFWTQTGKVKEETCNMKVRMGSLGKEIEKRELIFLAQNLEKELCHCPNLSTTETAKEYLDDMLRHIKEKVDSNLDTLDGLLYKVNSALHADVEVVPEIKPSFGESKTNALFHVPDLLHRPRPFQVEFVSAAMFGRISCVNVIEEDLVATGHSDNDINIWNLSRDVHVTSLKGHSSAVSALTSIKSFFPEITLKPGVSVGTSLLKSRNQKQQNFLVSGCEGEEGSLILWDMQSFTKLKAFSGHSGSVTSLVSLRDGHTIISGGLDGVLKVWDISEEKPVAEIREDSSHGIHYIHIFNDFSQVGAAGKSGDISLYRISYAYNKRYDRTVFESLKKIRVIKTPQPIFVMNESMMRDNLIISGGSEKSISFWNTITGIEQKKVGTHTTDIIGCVLIENPLTPAENSFVLSFGNYDDRILITATGSGESKEMSLDQEIALCGGKYSNPNLQFMSVTDVFGKVRVYLLGFGLKNNGSGLVKILMETEDGQAKLC
jgi:hypothetical protein